MATKKQKKPGKNWKKFWKLGVDEFNTQFLGVNKDGDLTATEGNNIYNLYDLACKFGTPLQVVFPFIIEDRLKDLIGYFQAYIKIYGYKGKFYYHYPMKVNQNREFILPLLSEGANLEVTSANELWIVKKLWEGEKFNTRIRVLCNGPKTDQYLDLIEELRGKGMNIIPIIESQEEIERLSKYKGDIGVRVDLDIKADTHWDKKFDRFGLSEKDVLVLGKLKNLKILHYHMGSQIKTQKSILEGVKRAFNVYVQLQKLHPSLDTLDIGGGFGVPYEKVKFYTAKGVSSKIVKTLKHLSDKAGIRHPNLAVEWGQYIVAPAQVTIYKVLSEKAIPKANAKAWYIVDGSFMNDLKDTWAIKQKWHTIPANNMFSPLKTVWLAGSTCDSDDRYTAGGNYILMPKLHEGKDQFIAILDTGAYQDALASHHCLLALPMKIILENGTVKIARKERPRTLSENYLDGMETQNNMHWKVNNIMNKIALPVVIIFFIAIFFMVRGTGPIEAPESIKEVRIGGQNIKVELAATPEDQAQGLSGRMSLREDEGMLFVFDTPGKYYFWMKGMNFAIDMIWIGEDRKVIYIKKDAKPEDYLLTFGPDMDSKYVLEVVSGFSDKYGLKEGDEVNFKY